MPDALLYFCGMRLYHEAAIIKNNTMKETVIWNLERESDSCVSRRE